MLRRSAYVEWPPEAASGGDTASERAPGDRATRLLISARRDPDALHQFYLATVLDVLRYFRSRVYDAEIAQDLTSETYAALLHSLKRFDCGRGSARQFLFGIANHQLLMWRRRGRVSARYQRKIGMPRLAVESNDDEVVERADLSRLKPRLHQALRQIRADDQLVIRLRLIDELAYADIAEKLACNEGAARVRVSRALARLAIVYAQLEPREVR